MLLWTRQKLRYPLVEVFCKNVVFASIVVLSDEETQYLDENDEGGHLMAGKVIHC